MAGRRQLFVYNSDNTATYNVSLDSSQALLGGFSLAAAGARNDKPGRMRLRYALLQSPTSGRERKLYISAADNPIYTGVTGTVTIEDFSTSPSTMVAWNVKGIVGERRYA